MKKELVSIIETQINKELYSAYLYYDIAEYFRKKGLDGFHEWFEDHAREEIDHAEKFAEYLQDNDMEFKLLPIEAPNNSFKGLRDALEFQVTHEKVVTGLIYKIYEEANKCDDLQTKNFIQWYVTEQMEEEKNAKELLEKYDLFAKDGGMGLYQLNKDLKKEVSKS